MFTTLKTKLTAATLAASIALTTVSAPTPAKALTEEEWAALILGAAIIAAASGATHPAPPAPAPTPRPRIHSSGPITLQQTYQADLDSGRVRSRGADIWFQAVDDRRKFITPVNGAKLAVGDRSNRGWRGCERARYSARRVSLSRLPVGSYVCVKTSAGRISQFRVNRISGGRVQTLQLSHKTWTRR